MPIGSSEGLKAKMTRVAKTMVICAELCTLGRDAVRGDTESHAHILGLPVNLCDPNDAHQWLARICNAVLSGTLSDNVKLQATLRRSNRHMKPSTMDGQLSSQGLSTKSLKMVPGLTLLRS